MKISPDTTIRIFPSIASLACFTVSAFVMAGWILKIPFLVQISPSFAPMQFNTALCFLLLGCVLLPSSSNDLFSKIAMGFLPIIPALTLVQYASGTDLGIDTFFVTPFVSVHTSHPGRMSPHSAFCFVALFVVRYALRLNHRSAFIPMLQFGLSSLILGCSIIAIGGYFSHTDEAYEWYGFTAMALHTAILFALSSFVSLVESIHNISESQYHRRLAPVYTTVSLLLVTLWGYHMAHLSAERDLQQKTAIQARTYKVILNSTFEGLSKSIDRMVQRWEAEGGTEERRWRVDANAYQRDLSGMVGIGYADSETYIRWIEPLSANQAAVGFRLNSESKRRAALDMARASGKTTITQAIELKQAGMGFLLISPIASDIKPSGFIYAAIRYSELFRKHLEVVGYSLLIQEGGKTLHRVNSEDDPESANWRTQEVFSFHGTDWSITLSPTKTTISQIPQTLAKFILAFGTLTSFSLGLLVLLMQRALKEKAKADDIAQWNDAIVLGSQLAIVSTDPSGVIRSYNLACTELFEYSESEVLGISTPAIWHDVNQVVSRALELSQELKLDIKPGFQVFTAKADLGQHYQDQWTVVTKSGIRKTVLLEVHALRDRHKKINGYVGILQDITQKLRTDLELKEALSKANEATLAKSRFLANMSHEIRTPINGVLGMAQILRDTKLDEDQRNFVEAIDSSGKNLLVIINDILDLSKIEANKLELEMIDFDLDELIKGIEQTLGFSANKKGITLQCTVTAEKPHWFHGDPTRLRQILLNLVNNAIKFTNQGSVTVSVAGLSNADSLTKLRFEVTDTGMGIPQEFIGKLFKAFAQTETSISRRFGGTGLGLSISSQLVQLMKGQIGVSSQAGLGSTFWFEVDLPIAPVPVKDSIAPALTTATRPLRILVAEDNTVNQIVARKTLEKIGHRVDVVANGREVLNSLLTISYDLILMDCNMPEMDGFEATRCIRQSKAKNYQDIPIIAMTASAMVDDHDRCIQAGMTDYISKPFRIQDLSRVIYQVTSPEKKISKAG